MSPALSVISIDIIGKVISIVVMSSRREGKGAAVSWNGRDIEIKFLCPH